MRHALPVIVTAALLATALSNRSFAQPRPAYSKASRVVVDLKSFSMMIPVPPGLAREDVQVVSWSTLNRLDQTFAPRVIERQDPHPCPEIWIGMRGRYGRASGTPVDDGLFFRHTPPPVPTGVRIERRFQVSEYDILIVSAKKAEALGAWLKRGNYRIPEGKSDLLDDWVRDGVHILIARVTQSELSPLQIRFRSPTLNLPRYLGSYLRRPTAPSAGEHDRELILYLLHPEGRVDCTNARTVKLPTGLELPNGLEDAWFFSKFRNDMIRHRKAQTQERIFLESAQRRTPSETQIELGCDWAREETYPKTVWVQKGETLYRIGRKHDVSVDRIKTLNRLSSDMIRSGQRLHIPPSRQAPRPTFVTRLSLHGDGTLPPNLTFKPTTDRTAYQARYVVNIPATLNPNECPEASAYVRKVEAKNLALGKRLMELTGRRDLQISGRGITDY